MPAAYTDTEVPVERSQREIRAMLRRYGADQFALGETAEHAEIAFRWRAMAVRMRVPIRPMTEDAARAYAKSRKRGAAKILEQRLEMEERRVWRVLYWLLKGRMEAIESGVETFEQAFLAHLLDPATERTVYESMVEHGAMRQLGAGEPV